MIHGSMAFEIKEYMIRLRLSEEIIIFFYILVFILELIFIINLRKGVSPDFAPAYYQLGYTLCKQRQDREALSIFEKYLEIAKDEPWEKNRFEFVKNVVLELRSGREGKNLNMIRGSK